MQSTKGDTVLEIRAADGSRRQVPLDAPTVLIGRAADARVLLESTAVSRQHAELRRDDAGRWRLHDLGSRNGTLVNGQPVREHALAAGDQVVIGGFELSLVVPGADGDTPSLPSPTQTGTGLLLSDDAGGRLSTFKDLDAPRVGAGHLTTLNDLSRDLLASDSAAHRALILCRLMVSPQFHGEWATILRLRRGPDEVPPEMLCDPQRSPTGRGHDPTPHVSRTLLRAVASQGEPVLASNVGPAVGATAAAAASLASANVELSIAPGAPALAAVACPMRTAADVIDVLYVTLPPQYGTSEWLALASLAAKQHQQAEHAWAARARAADHAALERELGHARRIQMRLVPKPPALAALRGRGVDVAVGFAPSHFVGGDYVDALALADGRVLLVVADVCGHGLAAALVTAAVHTMVHAAARAGFGLAALADGLNQHLCETLGGESFVTFAALAIDPASGAVECVNAGHPPPAVVTAAGDVRAFATGNNLPLGLDPGPLEAEAQQLAAGDVLLLYSDGLSEQADTGGTMLGTAGLKEQFRQLCAGAASSADALAGRLGAFLSQRQGGRPPADDQSYLFARRV